MKTIKGRLNNFNIENLDMFERMQYDHFIKSISKAEALQVLINNVEGYTTQLSEKLAEIAEMQNEEIDADDLKTDFNEYLYNKGYSFEEVTSFTDEHFQNLLNFETNEQNFIKYIKQ